MNELRFNPSRKTIDSREVAEMVEKRNDHLMRDIDGYVEILANPKLGRPTDSEVEDFFIASEYIDAQGKTRRCYEITQKGCEFIANKLTGQKGVIFTARYVNRFHELEQQAIVTAFDLPRNYSEALRRLADSEDEKEQLRAENATLAPKAEFHDMIVAAENSISIARMAMLLKQAGVDTGEKRFFRQLRAEGYLNTAKAYYNKPSQRSLEMGILECKETPVPIGGITINRFTPLVTGKGQVHFLKKYAGAKQLEIGAI